MSATQRTDEFTIETARQIVEQWRPAAKIAERLVVSVHSLYCWFGQRYRYCIKRDAKLREAKCIMQEATFDHWRYAPRKGLKLLDGRRGEWR